VKKAGLPVILLFLFYSCETFDNVEESNCIPGNVLSFTPVELTIDTYRDNVLRKQLIFSTDDSSSCYVIYWKDGGRQIVTRKTRPGINHSFILINLEEQSTYSYLIIQEGLDGSVSSSEVMAFHTEKLPDHIDKYSFNSSSHIYYNTFDEFILTHQRSSDRNLLILLNHQGKIIWYEKFTKSPKVFNWTQRGTIISMLDSNSSLLKESDEILEISLSGDTITHILKGPDTFDKGLHHDIMLNREENIYAINYQYKIMNFSPLGIEKTDTVFCDGIIELDTRGNKIWEWSVFDVMDPLEDPLVYARRSDWLHANSIYEDNDNNLLISFRHNNQIWKISRATGEVIWKFGENGDFELPEEVTFSGQHHINFSKNGDLMLFDNNNEQSRSRILQFSLKEDIMKAVLTYEIPLPPHYNTYIMGSVYETGNNKLLVNSTAGGNIALMDYDGSVIWEIGTVSYPYRAILVPDLNNNYLYCE
jgi:arylsulfate sulfotransferase